MNNKIDDANYDNKNNNNKNNNNKNNTIIKFLIIGDLHGEKPLINSNNFHAIICPGDICGDEIRPYWTKIFEKRKEGINLSLNDVCPKWKQKILELKSIQKGKKILKYLNSFNKPVFLVPGNWEPVKYCDGIKVSEQNTWEDLVSKYENIFDVEYRKIIFKNIEIIGHGSTSAPEQFIKEKGRIRRYNFYQNKLDILNNLFNETDKLKIFISHNVPYNTKLDLITNPKSNLLGKHYGSTLARKLILKHNPILCIGGHIHESYGKDILKNTTCINAGFGGEVNTIVEIDIKKKEILRIEFLGKNKGT